MKDYMYSKKLDKSFEELSQLAKAKIEEEGFTILNEIRIDEKINGKLGKDLTRYLIIELCNPTYAYRALELDMNLGVMMPCRLVVYENYDESCTVSTLKMSQLFNYLGNSLLIPISDLIDNKLKIIVDNLK